MIVDSLYPDGPQFGVDASGEIVEVQPKRERQRLVRGVPVLKERPPPPPLREALAAWATWYAEEEMTLTSVTRAMVDAAQAELTDEDLAAIIRPWAVAVERGPDQLNAAELDLWRSYGSLDVAQEAITDGMIACDEGTPPSAPSP